MTMKRYLKNLPLPALLLAALAGPVSGQQHWERTFGGDSYDTGLSIGLTPDGGFIVAGNTASYGAGATDVYLIKLDASGDTVWTRCYGGAGVDDGYSVQPTADGGYIVAGITNSSGSGLFDYYLLKTDADGRMLWERTYGGAYDDLCYSVQQTADSGYVLAGWRLFGSLDTAAYLVKTDADGDTVWSRMYQSPTSCPNFLCYSARQTSDGGYVLVGHNRPLSAVRPNIYLVKTDAAGDTVWTRAYGPAPNDDLGYSVRQTSDGGYIIAGSTGSNPSVNTDVYLVKTDAGGDSVWAKKYDFANRWDCGMSVEEAPDGGYIVTGMAWPSATSSAYDFFLIKTNAQGDTAWARLFGGAGQDVGWSVKPAPDGGFIAGGWTESFGSGPRDVYVIKTDASGSAVAEPVRGPGRPGEDFIVKPNPFVSFASVAGREKEVFTVFDLSGRKVAECRGARIGDGLPAGVYFLSPGNGRDEISRIVKIR